MTYCLAIAINEGLGFSSDSRTDAGADQVRIYSKMPIFGVPGDRQFVLLSVGNLATGQAVIAQLERDISDAAKEPPERPEHDRRRITWAGSASANSER